MWWNKAQLSGSRIATSALTLTLALCLPSLAPGPVAAEQQQDVLKAFGMEGSNTAGWGSGPELRGPEGSLWGPVTAARPLPCYQQFTGQWVTVPAGDTALIYDRPSLDDLRRPWVHVNAFWNDADPQERTEVVFGYGGPQTDCYVALWTDTSAPASASTQSAVQSAPLEKVYRGDPRAIALTSQDFGTSDQFRLTSEDTSSVAKGLYEATFGEAPYDDPVVACVVHVYSSGVDAQNDWGHVTAMLDPSFVKWSIPLIGDASSAQFHQGQNVLISNSRVANVIVTVYETSKQYPVSIDAESSSLRTMVQRVLAHLS